MQKIKAFFYIFKNSISNPAYYPDILETRLKFSLKYFLSLAVLASTITFVFTVIPATADLEDTVSSLKEAAVQAYPQDLVITVRGGKMDINKPEPYLIKMPEDASEQSETPSHVVVFDSAGTLNDLKTHDTLILVNETNILVQNTNKIEVYPLSDFPDEEITAEDVKTLAAFFDPFIKSLPYIVMAFSFLFLLTYYFGYKLFYLLFVGLILMVVGKVKNVSLPFSKFYQLGVHAITLPFVIEVIADTANIPTNYPFWFLALTLLMGVLGIAKIGSKTPTN